MLGRPVVVGGLAAHCVETDLEAGIAADRRQPIRYSRAASDSPNPTFGVPVKRSPSSDMP